jgi:hypothetical protein
VKRSDLASVAVLAAVRERRFEAFEHLCEQHPAKVVRAAISRDVRAGLLECGVSLDRPWLSPAGEQRLSTERGERDGQAR